MPIRRSGPFPPAEGDPSGSPFEGPEERGSRTVYMPRDPEQQPSPRSPSLSRVYSQPRSSDESWRQGCQTATERMITSLTVLFALFALQISHSIAFTEMYRISFMYTKNLRYDSYETKSFSARQQLCSIRSHLKATTPGSNEGQVEEPSESNTLSDVVTNVSFSDTSPQRTTSTGPSNRMSGNSNPLIQGEVTMDGSLLVLVPAAVIAILGFIVSISIALNSPDEIVSSFEFKPRNEQSVPVDVCRGLCSSQEDDLNKLREFWKISY